MKLFSDDFPEVRSDEELQALMQLHPDYDAGYLCQASSVLRKKTKAWMEKLWKQYHPHADSHFLEEFKRQFTQRAWELYLGVTLLNNGFKLGKQKDDGPDFEILNVEGKPPVWIEAIAVKKGGGNDRVPDLAYGTVSNIPTDEMVLRIAAGLDTKYKKYCSDLKNGFIKENEPYVIAIDRSELEHVDALLPNILKALFGIGTLALHVRVGGKRVKRPKSSWTSQFEIIKRSGSSVPMLFFENPEHAGISAVIYTRDHVINSPRGPKQMGQNFTIVHNPYAKNPLPDSFFPFGDIHRAEEGFVKKIIKRKAFRKPNPFSY